MDAAPSIILSDQTSCGRQLFAAPDLQLSGQGPRVQKRHPLGAKGAGTFGRLGFIHESPLLSGHFFQRPHLRWSSICALFTVWLPAIDHQQGTPRLLNKRRGLYAKGLQAPQWENRDPSLNFGSQPSVCWQEVFGQRRCFRGHLLQASGAACDWNAAVIC